MAKRILVQAGVHGPHPDGQYVRYEDYERLRQKAEELVLESAKIYAAYNKLVEYGDFMDMQTIQELADLV